MTTSLLTASIGTTAMAVPLSSLLGGGTLTAGNVTFSDFTFSEFGYDGDAGNIDVTTFVGPTSVTLEFDFFSEPLVAASNAMSQIGGSFTATLGRTDIQFTQQTLRLGSVFHDRDAFLSQVTANTSELFVSSTPSSNRGTSSAPLTGTVFSDSWFATAENTGGGFGATGLDGIVFSFEAGPEVVPLPASFVLLGAGLAGLGALRRRKPN